jgi:Flp pilus assembly protein TadB
MLPLPRTHAAFLFWPLSARRELSSNSRRLNGVEVVAGISPDVGLQKEVVMPLSEHEQKLLEQLEKQLHEDDPKFANSMGSDPGRSWSTRHVVIGVLCALAGVFLLLVGVTLQNIFVGVLGFVVMGGGVYFATMRSSRGTAGAKAGGDKPGKQRSSFMSNLEERWDERRRGEP